MKSTEKLPEEDIAAAERRMWEHLKQQRGP
jgi:phage-related protein